MSLKNILILCAASLLWSCANNTKNENIDDFDVTKILVNAADNIIVPQLKGLKESAQEVDNAFSDFNQGPNSQNLSLLQSKFKSSYQAWQTCSFINFGNSSFNILANVLNTFPTDTQQINSLFQQTDPILELTLAAIAYPGFDYTFFGGNENEIINRISTHGKIYCEKNIELIKSKSEDAYNFWKNDEDGYYTKFKSDDTKTISSPFTVYVNAFCKDLEVLKNDQLKAPGGQEFFIFPLPEQSEALFSGISLELFRAHLANLERIYTGDDISGSDGIGFDDYLKELGTLKDGKYLNDLILNTFATIEEKVNLLDGSINEAASSQKPIVDELYANVKKLVSYTKTDMSYAFGVNISYADPQDGD
jgi:predicted lipoprotein